jgi:hypothetical protein
MDLKTAVFLLADALMVAAGVVYGWKFVKKRNYLLGIEWWVVATSGTNFFFYALTKSQFLYDISYFFDAFSRAFGFPLIAVAGLMVVTHRYRPSALTDVVWFVGCIAATFALISIDAVVPAKPWFYLVMWTVYSAYLAYFIWRLLRVGERRHALGMTVVLVSSQLIATIYDFFHIPGDDPEHTLFYIAALSTWAYALFETYYAYCALERAEKIT